MPLENMQTVEPSRTGEGENKNSFEEKDKNAGYPFDALELLNSVKDSVVDLTSISHWGILPTGIYWGKGFFIADPHRKPGDNSCLIVTDNHVIGENDWISAKTNDGKYPIVEVDYRDKENDLAYLRITNRSPFHCPKLYLADGDTQAKPREMGIIARAGDSNPRKYYYVQPTRTAPRSNFSTIAEEGENPSRPWMALVGVGGEPGDSGAPYVNRNGRVEGIVVAGSVFRVFATPAAEIQKSLLRRQLSKQ